MLFLIQFPLADSRKFLKNSYQLKVPFWPLPTPDVEFVRHFGIVRIRKGGGVEGWVGENEICEADCALKFSKRLKFLEPSFDFTLNLYCPFRRFYFDGLAVGKYEVGFATTKYDWYDFNILSKIITNLLNHLFSLPVRIKSPLGPQKTCELIQAGKYLSQLYLESSTVTPKTNLFKCNDWWVRSGPPLFLIKVDPDEIFEIPYKLKVLLYKKEYDFSQGLFLGHCLVPYRGKNIQTFVLHVGSDININDARSLRLYLTRLYAEHECLRLILRNILEEKIIIAPFTEESSKLQHYFNVATKRIARIENKSEKKFSAEISKIAREAIEFISPGQKESLLNIIEGINIRKNIYRKIENYMEVTFMRDKYDISGQAGAVGPGAHAHDIQFQQIWNQVQGHIDLSLLIEDLEKLKKHLKEEAETPEQLQAVTDVSLAEKEAKAGNGPKVLEYLKKAGQWAFDTATKIGTSVAAEVIKKALGL
ncbi:MAG: hypothetical protein Q8M54_07085 [Desulfobaccales bacterium]|nr:hypothetical protein [Desulfobaccales bacterium]